MSVVVKESTPNLAYDESTSFASHIPNLKSFGRLEQKIQVDSKQARKINKGHIVDFGPPVLGIDWW